ncbi:hypothetical protein HPB47_016872 [Ixodes persulcatus]|uniref:Uncharacterized protein n=1 Tax=Ixodes persulcatus TaxID=34615 RepID=A0AC60QPW0_IXOPE|nr:hypothetical protein HPB47_016872 [Ixodes persulcatus]
MQELEHNRPLRNSTKPIRADVQFLEWPLREKRRSCDRVKFGSRQAASALESADAAAAEIPETRPVASSTTTETAETDSVSASTVPTVPETSVACSESEAASAQVNTRTTRAPLLRRKPAWQRDFVMN